MNVLLVYPEYPEAYFGFKYALRFISKKASVPPIGLITVSAMFPSGWQKKLVDLNISPLLSSDLEWADYVFVSAMMIQKESLVAVIEECRKHQVKIVAGGPLFTHDYGNYPQIDHFILNEAEVTFPAFLNDIERGKTLQNIYRTDNFAVLKASPTPDFHLLAQKEYAYMNIQISRGCPFSCDFCEIPSLLGHKVRMKETKQIIKELDTLYNLNWRGWVFIVDDNFIGNIKEIKNKLLPAMIKWMKDHNYPFDFYIQSSIDLSDDEELISMMVEAGINSTFIGIETPSEKSLHNCKKVQNENRDLLKSVKKIQKAGMQVSGGFIVGFDSDTPDVFQGQIDFIQQSGIVWAVVGLLNAPPGTRLYNRLEAENRISKEPSGSNIDYTMNFIPKMNKYELLAGYKNIIENIYGIKPYYKRIRQFSKNYKPKHTRPIGIESNYLTAFFKSLVIIGIVNKGRGEYWKLLIWTLLKHPVLIKDVIIYIITGYHFRKVYGLNP